MIYFLIYLFLETFITTTFSSYFGSFVVSLEFVGSFILGLFLLKNINLSFSENIQQLLRREITQQEFISIGLFRFVGVFLLIIPGILTDIIGLLMQFEELGASIGRKIIPMKEADVDNFKKEDIVDVEIIEEKKDDRNS